MSDFIDFCQPDPARKIYLVGGFAWRISIHTQQRRAIRLVHDLFIEQHLRAGDKVAVIGAGAAGLACAAALVQRNVEVQLFEAADHLLPLQGNSTQRFVHPNSTTWPQTPMRPYSDLPFLNWHAGCIDEIVEAMRFEFGQYFGLFGAPGVLARMGCQVTEITEGNRGEIVRYLTKEKMRDDYRCNAVILCTGFGREQKISGCDSFSYWEDTSPAPFGTALNKAKVAIIGDGDGALLEVFRCTWGEAQLEQIYQQLDQEGEIFEDLAEAKATIKYAETVAKQVDRPTDADCQRLAAAYEDQLAFSDSGRKLLLRNLRNDVQVTLISPRDPYSPRASPAHKVLLAFLKKKAGLIEFHKGRAEGVSFDRTSQTYTISAKTSRKGDPKPLGPYDRIFERLGPRREYCKLTRDTFGRKLVAFKKSNAGRLILLNPNHTDDFGPDSYEIGPVGRGSATDLFRAKLAGYFQRRVKDATFAFPEQCPPGKLAVVHPPEFDQSRDHWPTEYFGYTVVYRSHGAKPSPASPCDPLPAPTDRSPVLAMGHGILDPIQGSASAVAAVAAVVATQKGRRFALTALHPFHDTATMVAAAAPPDDHMSRIIGSINRERFARQQQQGNDSRYNCLRDILAIELRQDVAATSELAGMRIRESKSSLKHYYYGSRIAILNTRRIGKIHHPNVQEIVRNCADELIKTDGFRIALDEEESEIIPGSPVFTEHRELLGMVVGQTARFLFCVDMDDVINRLGCRLA